MSFVLPMSYVICFFCCRSPNSESQCSLCSRLFVENENDFVSTIKYDFSLIFSNNKIFSEEIELLFVQSRKTRFNLDVLYSSETHYKLVDSKQNRCMNFLVAKHPCDSMVFLSEVYVRILTNQVVSISNDLLRMPGKYDLTKYGLSKRNLFLDSCVIFIRCFCFDMCKLLRLSGFFHICENFAPNADYSAETFKIINKSYLECCAKKFNK